MEILRTHAFSSLKTLDAFDNIMNTLTWYLYLGRLQMSSPKIVNIDVTTGEFSWYNMFVCWRTGARLLQCELLSRALGTWVAAAVLSA